MGGRRRRAYGRAGDHGLLLFFTTSQSVVMVSHDKTLVRSSFWSLSVVEIFRSSISDMDYHYLPTPGCLSKSEIDEEEKEEEERRGGEEREKKIGEDNEWDEKNKKIKK